MLKNDNVNAKVKTLNESIFPKGTNAKIIGCAFIEKISDRVYLIQTNDNIKGLVYGLKSEWYLERDLVNID